MDNEKDLEEFLASVEANEQSLESLDAIMENDAELKELLGDIVSEAKNSETQAPLSDEELARINEMETVEVLDVQEKADKKKAKKEARLAKKEAKKQAKEEKKAKKKNSGEEVADVNQEENAKEKKSKKGFKKAFADLLFEDVDVEDEVTSEDEDLKSRKPKKEKAKKESKPEKEKKPKKEKKSKVPTDPSEKVKFSPVKVILFITFVISVVALVLVWTKAFNYYNDMTTAKEYYKDKNYVLAYEKMSGMDIRPKDAKFYQQVRQIMLVEKQRNSYYKFTTLGDDMKAFDSLLKCVKVHTNNSENDKKLGVYEITSGVYAEAVELLLTEFGVNESDAIYYSQMENYLQYYEILKIYGGNRNDSNN